MPRETVATSSDGPADVAELDQRRAEFLKIVSGGDRV
jgi:hypothetical protein